MPHYDYRCEACGHEFEAFQSISAEPLTECPACSRPRLKRLLGGGGGLLFKGSGFYATDYRSGGNSSGGCGSSGNGGSQAGDAGQGCGSGGG